MVFQFQILGLLIVFLLVVFYYMGYERSFKKEKGFKYLLLGTYLSQLVYICTYIALKVDSYYNIYAKVYLILILGIYSGLSVYYLSFFVREKYKNQLVLLEESLKKLKLGLLMINIGSAFLLLFSNVTLVLDRLIYKENIFMILLTCFLVMGFVSLYIGRNVIQPKKYINLWVVYLISISSFVLQYYFDNLAIVNVGLVVMIFYLYVTIENLDTRELENLRLERDYNSRQNIDKEAFLKNISHEIRTPINTIDGFSQIILDSNDMTEIKSDVEDIRIASRDLIDVINGMIDLSIIESGNLEIVPENYNVYDMLEQIVDIANSKLKEKKVDFEVVFAKDIPEVLWGDSERISQVILNILKNSIKYTDKGKIIFRVESVKSKTKCRLKFIIEDTGKGMKEEEIQNIFVESNENKRNGLGLLVSKYLLELMDGNLEINSTYQEGTIMTVVLDQKIISERSEDKVSGKKDLKPFKAEGKRILVVDDNKLNLKVAMKLLSPYNVEVVEANSGQECLDLLERDTRFDLILMDDLMPEMSGSETLDILKKIQRVDGYYIPVVVVTANAVSGQREKYLEMGFEDYLSKPIERYELDRVLKKYLKGRK